MKYAPLIWAGLWRKRLRTILTMLSIVVAFVLFGILQGVDASLAHILDQQHLDRLMVDSKFGTAMPIAYLQQIQDVPGVTAVAPWKFAGGYWQDPKKPVPVIATTERMFTIYPEFTATKDELLALGRTRTAAIVSVGLAKKYDWKVGDKFPVTAFIAQKDGSKTWTYDIVGLTDGVDGSGDAIFAVVNYDYVDEASAENNGTANRYVVRIRDPGQAAQVSQSIDKLFANSAAPTRTQPEKSATQSQVRQSFDVSFFTKSVVSAVFFTLLLMTANTLMQSVRERIPEFAVLKTMGYSDAGVLAIVLAEAVLLCVVAALVGLGVAKAALPFAKSTIGDVARVPLIVIFDGVGGALLVAVISAALPAWRAKRLSVVDALSGRVA